MIKPIFEVVAFEDRAAFLGMALIHFGELNPNFVPQADWKASYFETIQSNPNLFLRWITVEGERVGFILYGLERHRFLPRTSGMIYELFVLSQHRRKGIAEASARQAIQELSTLGISKIQLEVMEGNVGAVALWEKLGFSKTSSRYVSPIAPKE